MGHHDDGHVEGFLQLKDQFIDASGDNGVEPGGRFIKKEDFRIHGHSTSHRRALLHPAAQLRWQVVFKTRQTHLIQLQPHDNLNRRFLEPGMLAERKRHILSDGHRPEQRATLKGHSDSFADCIPFCVGDCC